MLHKNVLMEARVRELEEQLTEITKHKARKRKRIQHSGIIKYSIAASYVATEVSIVPQPSKKAYGSGGQEKAQPTQRHCRNYGETGYNTYICKIDKEEASESNASVLDVYSLASNE